MSKTISLLLLTAALISFTALTDLHGQKAAQPKLPDGPGKDILQNACTECHDLQMVYDTGYNKQEWQLLVERMITARYGRPEPDEGGAGSPAPDVRPPSGPPSASPPNGGPSDAVDPHDNGDFADGRNPDKDEDDLNRGDEGGRRAA